MASSRASGSVHCIMDEDCTERGMVVSGELREEEEEEEKEEQKEDEEEEDKEE